MKNIITKIQLSTVINKDKQKMTVMWIRIIIILGYCLSRHNFFTLLLKEGKDNDLDASGIEL